MLQSKCTSKQRVYKCSHWIQMEKCYVYDIRKQFAEKELINAKFDDVYVNNYLKNNRFDGTGACPFEVTGYIKKATKVQKVSGENPVVVVSKKANWTHSEACNSTPRVLYQFKAQSTIVYLHMNNKFKDVFL